MYKKYKNKRGETILETVIAMGILAIGITISSAIIGSSIRNMNTSKNRIIAVNIAREGVEAMRNIRDTNWLKYRHKIRQCWNNYPPQDPAASCSGDINDAIKPGDFIIYKQDTERWRLEENQPVLDPDGEPPGVMIDNAFLYLVDVTFDPPVDTDLDRDYFNDKDAYNHAVTVSNDALGKDYRQKTPFRRVITIEYLDNEGDILSTGDPTVHHNRMRITATVSWRDGKNEFSTQLSTHITDYLGRERLPG